MYLQNAEIAAITSSENHVGKMIDFEVALAKVQGQLGLIPLAAASEIAEKIPKITIPAKSLEFGTLQNGVPTITLIEIAKNSLSPLAKDYLHFGATSQDVVDTATVLMIKDSLIFVENKIKEILLKIGQHIHNEADTIIIGRTRTQQAIPITLGQKLSNWGFPLFRQLDRLAEMKPRLLVVQFGGAAGNLAALEDQGFSVSESLALELGLNYALPWHSQRDNLAEFASWLSITSGILGKIAIDILAMSQTEVGEITENATGGKSSTMPHKNNPVLSEAIVALARKNAGLLAIQMQSLIHTHERDGAAWLLEWDTLPQMINHTGTALVHANNILSSIRFNTEAMSRNLNLTNGLIFSEKASFILSEKLPKNEAKILVEKACERVLTLHESFINAISHFTPDLGISWANELTYDKNLGISYQITHEFLAKIEALSY
jgi:3-carboxy-cis,cis-muconate cycloisomerase